MKFLTPYESPVYFIYIAIAFIPIIIQLLRGKRIIWYQNLVTLFFLYISFGGVNRFQGIAIILYVVWQVLLGAAYFRYRQKKNNSWVFYGTVLAGIAPLVIVKVAPIWQINPTFIGFLGISYLTFKAVQMIMEIRDGIIKEFHIGRYIQFLIFFPTISSGPIDRYRRFEKELTTAPTQNKYFELLSKGIHNIFLGCLYKYILGYILGAQLLPYVKEFAINQGGVSLGVLAYMYVYSLYLFFDFAGYSLFAVGTSYLMGYETPINFNKPFLSPNIKEFWNRWHMSLSFWFRDYVYMRLMFTLMKKKVFKSRITTSNVGYFALFLLMGVWHGLTWYYIVYGLYHALLICINDAWLRFKKKHKEQIPSNKFTQAFAIFITFHAVCFSFLIFSGFIGTLIGFPMR
ncbi:D-alanyl-lipoteichoic acid biosynthesis protein DltB [Vagococcus entomophilus]|uniref:Teichoic acid D-alanyltransferase n=1 Tax=Vagococcus entomophilus TaxID=1160095 RepID=A0A430AFM3_9ENTE|nr:D-alanyl-lipoteichoic acid biosynthesis protein DltB [Vagococcus entomophilus]RSU06514.1 D-alanyl-lipoteichoic acid biosynthesis protein DltB [Vagococcus entomophilus]